MRINFYKLCLGLLVVAIMVFGLSSGLSMVKADELDEIANQIQQLQRAKEQSANATKPLEIEVERLHYKLNNVRDGLARVRANVIALEKSIKDREVDLQSQYQLLGISASDYYKNQRSQEKMLLFFSRDSIIKLIKQIIYQKQINDENKKIIIQISKEINQLDKDKQKVQKDKQTLEKLQEVVASQKQFFEGEIKGAKDYQKDLSKKIIALTKKQAELLAKKTETFQTSVGNVPQADDPASRPDYNPGFSPAFALFSFGAPHFKGMSQYGAFGRAKEGQSFEQILKAYYGDVHLENVDTNFDIPTTAGNMSLEDRYLKGIAEMPTGWADQGGYEALKAQAVVARSYALAYVGWRMGDRRAKKSICTTENCQVYNANKANNPGRWGDAVNDTKGKILVSNKTGEIVNAWYASTSGGYQESYSSLGHSTPGFWDTKNGRSGWTSQAYEKIAGSPWFYKGWYKTRGGTTCGRKSPWLNQGEMADIINAVIVYSSDKNTQSHLSQQDSGCFGDPIPDTWDKNKLASEADHAGGRVTKVNSVSVTYANNGVTAQVTFDTNRGRLSFSGDVFYKVFNLRAPGAIHLTSGLYNVESK